ncbi:morc family cw-type zinc finger protein 3 [Phtheirospermum japonicum]|uniref:Morc family cw-type zinc finger protein 3 n=1 Tax=Phtheirospermum japonicum TaxID=374723 RepID=A0A830CEX1_9LAMI|nr:morc family cw-type zinc finger protein 3 [Phtheirospermum japonicum]
MAVGPVKQEISVEKGKEKPVTTLALLQGCKQFWKAGDYEGSYNGADQVSLADMDHVRVHPRFLHSNATSHKWALGAFAELLDNALDEELNGATYVLVDVLKNMKNRNKMVLVQDDGGGMTPDKMRQCMSLGYSEKSKMANTIGQYGNGFKTSTMRLGADVIVFSRCKGKYGSGRLTQSIGLLSYTFLRSTGKEDIVVPMIDYDKIGETWNMRVRSSSDCWQRNLETIVQWSPFETEEDLLGQFDFLSDQGTRIIIYNLWEDDEGLLELDFETDPHDIQIRSINRDEKIEMAKTFPSSRHFLTYRHSLRSYTSILYLRIPLGFRIILRGKEVEHHNIVDDMMYAKEIVYKPTACADAVSKDPNMSATVTLGFIKDAESHIDVQGFNVYHKNRLIKPFWRVWNAAGSDGRGVIGVLQANFVEPAHDKQGFERTTLLSRLEARLVYFQKQYWSSQCQLIGYAQRRNLKKSASPEKEPTPCAKDKPNSKCDTNPNVPSNDASTSKSTNRNEHRYSPANEAAGRNLFEATQATVINNLQPESSSGGAAGNVPIKVFFF